MDLKRLREIGWALWNPIGLSGPPAPPTDAYDAYLLEAVRRLGRGDPLPMVAAYLVAVERDDMGLRATTAAETRALATVRALEGALRAAALDLRRQLTGG